MDGDVVEVNYYHRACNIPFLLEYPCPESQDAPVYCAGCGLRIAEIPLTTEGKQQLVSHLNEFQAAYIECALWCSLQTDEEGNMQPNLQEEGYQLSDLTTETVLSMLDDCRDFEVSNAEHLKGCNMHRAGHDFWLTRNRHGTGFWDGPYLTEVATALTSAAHAYGSSNLCTNDECQVVLE